MAKRSAYEETSARLAVIEEKVEAILGELAVIREYIPGMMVQHSERINVIERAIRNIQWLGGVVIIALVGSFVGHVLGR